MGYLQCIAEPVRHMLTRLEINIDAGHTFFFSKKLFSKEITQPGRQQMSQCRKGLRDRLSSLLASGLLHSGRAPSPKLLTLPRRAHTVCTNSAFVRLCPGAAVRWALPLIPPRRRTVWSGVLAKPALQRGSQRKRQSPLLPGS